MATMLDIITRACRKSGVTAIDEVPEAEITVHAMGELNGMLSEWALRGVDLSYSDLEPSDTFPLDNKFRDGTVYMLAERISPEFQRPRSFDADDFFRAIQAAYMTIDEVTMPKALTETYAKDRSDWVG